MITWHDAPQGSDEWLDARMGLLTASNFKTAFSKGSTRDTLMRSLAKEIAWGAREEGYKSAAMQRGNDLEPEARQRFIEHTGLPVTEVGLATNSKLPGMGASLDGIIGSPAGSTVGLEIKCPLDGTLARYHHDNTVKVGRRETGTVITYTNASKDLLPAEYRLQIAAQMLICELTTVHFFAWHPGPSIPALHLVIDRGLFDIDDIATKAAAFVMETNAYADKLPRAF